MYIQNYLDFCLFGVFVMAVYSNDYANLRYMYVHEHHVDINQMYSKCISDRFHSCTLNSHAPFKQYGLFSNLITNLFI